ADAGDLRLEGAVAVEHLDTLVAGVGNVDIALGIDRDRAGGGAELARLGTLRTPRFDEHAVLVELRDALVADAVGHVDVSSGVESDVGRAIEEIGRSAGAGRLTGRWRRNGGAAGSLSARPHRHGLGFAAQQEGNAALGVELDDHVRHLIDNPDVVLRIDADLLGEQERIDILADLANELAVAIELQQPRAAVGKRARGADRNGRMAGPRVDENIALGIGRDATDFAEVNVVR